ncbi:hypothetical protein E2C01_042130 [Portunus trituberculatus]|uniref:Uncharacterized protein n=1 Tax=Portunus trituberculatus TaxID=210409 RepID=A0A5B7FKY9_PORTR|nr:hypothetical protein [Portunus trituberculatus]
MTGGSEGPVLWLLPTRNATRIFQPAGVIVATALPCLASQTPRYFSTHRAAHRTYWHRRQRQQR